MKEIHTAHARFGLRLLFAVACLMLVCFNGVTDEKVPQPRKDECATWKAEAVFVGLSFNHLVHIENACETAVSCRVKTDVNPKEEIVDVPAKSRKTHLTFRGSPAREFKASVFCSPKE